MQTEHLAVPSPWSFTRMVARLFRSSPVRTRKALLGYLFLTPWLVGFIVLTGGPILASLSFSFTNYNGIDRPRWVGLANYRRAFFEDDLFWPSLGRTFYYACSTVPLGLAGSLLLAALLNQELWGTNVFRTLLFMPHLIPTVAAAVLWIWFLHPVIGPLNNTLRVLGLPHKIGWLVDKRWAIPAMIMISLWASMGGNRMIIFLAGLQGVPAEFYDAAEIDGAGSWQKFRHITVPTLTPRPTATVGSRAPTPVPSITPQKSGRPLVTGDPQALVLQLADLPPRFQVVSETRDAPGTYTVVYVRPEVLVLEKVSAPTLLGVIVNLAIHEDADAARREFAAKKAVGRDDILKGLEAPEGTIIGFDAQSYSPTFVDADESLAFRVEYALGPMSIVEYRYVCRVGNALVNVVLTARTSSGSDDTASFRDQADGIASKQLARLRDAHP